MPNINAVIDMVTREALRSLDNQLTFTKTVNRKYESSFAKSGFKIGGTLNIRKPVRTVGRREAPVKVESQVETTVPLRVNTQYGADMSFSSAELALDIDDFSKRYIQPAILTIANMIDYDGLQLAKQVYQSVGTAGTPPTTLTPYLAAKAKLDFAGAYGEKHLVLSPDSEIAVIPALQNTFNPSQQISEQYIKGSMGKAAGFQWMMDQNICLHTVGTFTGTPLMRGATAQGASTLVTDGWGAGSFLNVGDVISVAGVYAINPQNRQSTRSLAQFVVTEQATADASGIMTINVSPALYAPVGGVSVFNQTVSALPADNATITVYGTSGAESSQNLAFCPDAFTFASVDLPNDMPGTQCSVARSEKLGLSIRLTRSTDIVNDRVICRLDLLGGWGTIYPELATRIWA